jgi:hypothetical protein
MANALDVTVGIQHGEACTCRKLDPVTVTPVIVANKCPGRDAGAAAPRRVDHAGSVIITWPRATAPAVSSWNVKIHDADSGRDLGPITLSASIGIDPRGFVTADLTMLADVDGDPSTGPSVLDEETGTYRTGVFRYVVAEMRVAYDGTLTINEERERLGLPPVDIGASENAVQAG